MKRTRPPQSRQRRRWLELEMFRPKAAQTDPYLWVNDLTDEEFAQMSGPSWSRMTDRQRALYPALPVEELDRLWGMSQEDHLNAA